MSFEGNSFRVDNTTPVEAVSESPDSLVDLQNKIERLKEQAQAAQLNIYELPEYDALDAVAHKLGVLTGRREKLTWERDPKIKERFSDVNNQIAKLLAEGNSYIDALSQMATSRSESFKKSVGDEYAAVRDQMTVYDRDYEEEKRKADLTPPAVAPEKTTPVVLPEPVAAVTPASAVEVSSTPEARLESARQNYNRAKEKRLIALQAWEGAKKRQNISARELHELEVEFDLAELAYIRAKRAYELAGGVVSDVESTPTKKGTRFNSLKAFLIGATIVTPSEQRAEEAVTQFPVVPEIGPSEPLFNTFGAQAPSQPTYGARRTQSFAPGVSPVESQPQPIEVVQEVPVYEEVVGTPADGSEMRDPEVFDSNPIAGIQTESPVASFNVNPITEYAPVFSSQSEVVAQVAPQVLENPVANIDSAENDVEEITSKGVGDAFSEHVKPLLERYSHLPQQLVDRLYHEQYARILENPTVVGLSDDTVFTKQRVQTEVDFSTLTADLERNLEGVDRAQSKTPYPEVTPRPGSNLTEMMSEYFPQYVPGFIDLMPEFQQAIVADIVKQLEEDQDLQIESRLFEGVHRVKPTESYNLEPAARMAEAKVNELTVAYGDSLQGELASQSIAFEQQDIPTVAVGDAAPETVVESDTPEITESAIVNPNALEYPEVVTSEIEEVQRLVNDYKQVLQETAPSVTPDEGNDKAVEAEPQNETSASNLEETEKVASAEERYEQLLGSLGVKKSGWLDSIFSSSGQRSVEFENLKKLTVGLIRDIVLRTKPGEERNRELLAYNVGDFELFNLVYQQYLDNKDLNILDTMTVEAMLRYIAKNNI